MNIVFVTPEFVTECRGGGLASYLSNIAKILAEHGHAVTIVTSSRHNNDSMEWYSGVIVERVKDCGKFLPVPFYNLWRSWRLCECVKKINKRRKIDIVQYASFEAVGFWRAPKIPSVVRISSDRVCWREYKVFDYQIQDIDHLYLSDKIEYAALKRIGNIYGPSLATAKIIAKRIGRDIPIIESPFYLKRVEFDYSLYSEKLKQKKYYLAHSSMSCVKGTHIIAQIIGKVCQQDRDAYFVFAGSDHGILYRDPEKNESAKDYIIRMAGEWADRVIFLGTVKREELFPIIDNAYACLMPSRIDNMPNTCIEAMALGKIVVGTRGASYEQFIEDGVSGYLVAIDDTDELYNTIVKINQLDGEERKRIGDNASRITERFNPEMIYRKIMQYYLNVIGGTGESGETINS